jgi:hypothetical protein
MLKISTFCVCSQGTCLMEMHCKMQVTQTTTTATCPKARFAWPRIYKTGIWLFPLYHFQLSVTVKNVQYVGAYEVDRTVLIMGMPFLHWCFLFKMFCVVWTYMFYNRLVVSYRVCVVYVFCPLAWKTKSERNKNNTNWGVMFCIYQPFMSSTTHTLNF